MSQELDHVLGLKWQAPPKKVRDAMRKLPGVQPLAEMSRGSQPRRLHTESVRSSGTALFGTSPSRIEVFTCPWADVTLRVSETRDPHVRRLELRIWLRTPSETAIEVALVSGDHVIAVHSVRDGEHLAIEEALAGMWQLEFRAVGHKPLQITGEST